MKRLSFVCLIALLACAAGLQSIACAQTTPTPAPSSPAAPGVAVVLTAGTPVSVSFVQQVSSDSATQGSTVAVQVTKEVDVDGKMLIAKGAQGQATLTKVLHSGGNGSGGKVAFNVDWVYSVDGGKVALAPVDNTTPNADRKGEASTLAIAGWATLGLAGLFSHNFAHGRAAIIEPNKVFTVFVDHTVHVTSSRDASAQPGFDN